VEKRKKKLWARRQKDACLSGLRDVNVIQKLGIALEKDK